MKVHLPSRLGCLAAVLLASSCLAGCSHEGIDVRLAAPATERRLTSGQSAGQTIVGRYSGLSGATVVGRLENASDPGRLVLHLRGEPGATEDLAQKEGTASRPGPQGGLHFSFPPIADSRGRSLYFELVPSDLEAGGAYLLGERPGDSYLDGALYIEGVPQDGQLAFSLQYEADAVWQDRIGDTLSWMALLMVALAIFVVPGAGLLAIFLPGGGMTWLERLALSGAVGLSLYPLLLLWAHTVGLHPGAVVVALPVVGGGLLVWLGLRRTGGEGQGRGQRGARLRSVSMADVVSLIALGAVVLTRLLPLRWLEGPSWGDSVQHAVIAQLMVDQGGLFSTWSPYAPYATLTVHFGFHAAVAALMWATGAAASWATLAAGQIINVAAVLSVAALATRLSGGNRWAGAAALVLAGLASDMPAFYLNWGRYPQLTGLAILPAAAWLLMDVTAAKEGWRRGALLAAIAVAGMTLSYYRMPFFLASLVAVWLVCYGLAEWRLRWKLWCRAAWRWVVAGLGSVVLVLPWLGNAFSGKLGTYVSAVAAASPVSPPALANMLLQEPWPYVPPLLAGLAVAGLAAGLALRSGSAVAAALSCLAWLLLPAFRSLPIPGVKFLDDFSVVISMYVPVAAAGAIALGAVSSVLGRARWGTWLVAAVLCGMALVGTRGQLGIVRGDYVMVTRPDLLAMDWIRRETPRDSRFLVQGFTVYAGTSTVGADAGWWIPLLTGRENTMPPQYALMDEEPIDAEYSSRVVDLVGQLQQVGVSSPAGIRLLCGAGVTHIYQGQGRGAVGSSATPLYTSAELDASPSLRPLYRRDRVGIYSLDPGACS